MRKNITTGMPIAMLNGNMTDKDHLELDSIANASDFRFLDGIDELGSVDMDTISDQYTDAVYKTLVKTRNQVIRNPQMFSEIQSPRQLKQMLDEAIKYFYTESRDDVLERLAEIEDELISSGYVNKIDVYDDIAIDMDEVDTEWTPVDGVPLGAVAADDHYFDGENIYVEKDGIIYGAGIGELAGFFSKVKNGMKRFGKKMKKGFRKAGNKMKKGWRNFTKAAKEKMKNAVQTMKRYNPALIAVRSAFRLGIRLNMGKLANKIAYGYLNAEEARREGISSERHSKMVQARNKSERLYTKNMGGQLDHFKRVVKKGNNKGLGALSGGIKKVRPSALYNKKFESVTKAEEMAKYNAAKKQKEEAQSASGDTSKQTVRSAGARLDVPNLRRMSDAEKQAMEFDSGRATKSGSEFDYSDLPDKENVDPFEKRRSRNNSPLIKDMTRKPGSGWRSGRSGRFEKRKSGGGSRSGRSGRPEKRNRPAVMPSKPDSEFDYSELPDKENSDPRKKRKPGGGSRSGRSGGRFEKRKSGGGSRSGRPEKRKSGGGSRSGRSGRPEKRNRPAVMPSKPNSKGGSRSGRGQNPTKKDRAGRRRFNSMTKGRANNAKRRRAGGSLRGHYGVSGGMEEQPLPEEQIDMSMEEPVEENQDPENDPRTKPAAGFFKRIGLWFAGLFNKEKRQQFKEARSDAQMARENRKALRNDEEIPHPELNQDDSLSFQEEGGQEEGGQEEEPDMMTRVNDKKDSRGGRMFEKAFDTGLDIAKDKLTENNEPQTAPPEPVAPSSEEGGFANWIKNNKMLAAGIGVAVLGTTLFAIPSTREAIMGKKKSKEELKGIRL